MTLQKDSTKNLDWLSGGGAMGALIRSIDWAQTPLGAVADWPQSLRTSVSLCLSSTFPISIVWGPEKVQLYNDSYRPICGAMHPVSMGALFWKTWESARPAVGEVIERADQGEGSYIENQRMFLERNGYLEEAFMTFSFSPIREESGAIGGLFHPITETTDKMLNARRTQLVRDLVFGISKAKSFSAIYEETCARYEAFSLDIPYLLFYECKGNEAFLQAEIGLDAAARAAIPVFNLKEEKFWPLATAAREGSVLDVTDVIERFGTFTAGPYPETPHSALIIPIIPPGSEEATFFVIAGVSSRRALDDAYRGFYESLKSSMEASVANILAYEQEQKRAEALAEIDRAKTTFFSNVSHELRTPLTLILGPLEDRMQNLAPSDPQYESTQLIYRNARRLLKLVNALLDFSRIEAGRLKARYVPTDLAALTRDLASVFRSAMLKAGLTFEVDARGFSELALVDRDMWERIILNLLSNALKYTMQGEVSVRFAETPLAFEISVHDTGPGLPAAELPKLFDRFHRVASVHGRTHEGTGIGLALVQELIKLHGGSIGVESTEGVGSIFTVSLLKGRDHLQAEQIETKALPQNTQSSIAQPFLDEAASWLRMPEDQAAAAFFRETTDDSFAFGRGKEIRASILVVDDNNDMRDYVADLLRKNWRVFTAADGLEALECIRKDRPDLVLTDVMMPRLDGFGLLQALRADAELCTIPVIMLSARAGEESKVEGLDAGANDYLVKPFSARELLARVAGTLELNRVRNEAQNLRKERDLRLRSTFAHAGVGMAILDPGLQYIEVNSAFCAITGYAEAEIKELYATSIIHPDDWPDSLQRFESLIAGKIPGYTAEKRLIRKDGSIAWVQNSVSVQRDADGGVDFLILICQDVSDRIRSQEEARKAYEEAEKANKTKSAFLANMSHEIRTPLGIIKGYTELLQESENNTSESLDWLATVHRNTLLLNDLVNDILDLSKVEADLIQIESIPFCLSSLMREVQESFAGLAQKKGIGFKIEAEGVIPSQIGSDPSRLRQILNNVIGNALKFTEKGLIRIKYNVASEQNGQHAIRFAIADSGIGLSEEDQGKLFQSFVQADASISRRFGGTGLGLVLSRNLARKLGGELKLAHSTPGVGSTFELTVLARTITETAGPSRTVASESDALPLRGCCVLVVDDSSDNQMLVRHLLKQSGAQQIDSAYEGDQAIRMALANDYHVVLMDVQMPIMGGFEAVEKLRACGYKRPIIALTAHAMKGYREECLLAGFDDYLVKPIDRKTLLATIKSSNSF